MAIDYKVKAMRTKNKKVDRQQCDQNKYKNREVRPTQDLCSTISRYKISNAQNHNCRKVLNHTNQSAVLQIDQNLS